MRGRGPQNRVQIRAVIFGFDGVLTRRGAEDAPSTPDTAMVEFARSLRPRYKTAVISDAPAAARKPFLGRQDTEWLFDLVVSAPDEGMGTADLRLYRLVAERLGLAPEECLLIDDAMANVAGARSAGMGAILHEGDTPRTLRAARALLG